MAGEDQGDHGVNPAQQVPLGRAVVEAELINNAP
jgi:hypothetical protein